MLPELENRITKLGVLFRDAESQVQGIASQLVTAGPPTRRQRMTALAAAEGAVLEVLTASRPHLAGLTKLAYVRGGRQVSKSFMVDDEGQIVVSRMVEAAHRQLTQAARRGPYMIDQVFRQMSLSELARSAAQNPTQSAAGALASTLQSTGFSNRATQRWGLEQYAHVAIRSVTERALQLGALAAQGDTSYDLQGNG